jgi:hypothetical protein
VVEVEVEVENVHRWLTEKDEESAAGVSVHYHVKLSDTHSPRLCYPCHLQARVGGADLGVEPTPAGRDGVGWNDGNGRRGSPNRGVTRTNTRSATSGLLLGTGPHA